jgi:predicted DNA-binding protein YlxM (UPF0122 family)
MNKKWRRYYYLERKREQKARKKLDTPSGVLSEDDVRKIRKLYATGKYSMQNIADIFDVSKTAIVLIMNGKTYKWVK